MIATRTESAAAPVAGGSAVAAPPPGAPVEPAAPAPRNPSDTWGAGAALTPEAAARARHTGRSLARHVTDQTWAQVAAVLRHRAMRVGGAVDETRPAVGWE